MGVSDAVLLDPLTEEAFIQNLKERFNLDQIYVSISEAKIGVGGPR